jgi:5-methylcytosine-specific restriction enzyme A
MLKTIKDILQKKIPKGARRSSQWSKIRADFLKLNPECNVCGGTTKVEVHHIVPFHEDPSLELVECNLVTLCENKKYGINCHLLIGHLGNYRKANPNCRGDAAIWKNKLSE